MSFQKEGYLTEGPLKPRLTQIEYAQFTGGLPAVGQVIIGGPYDAAGLGNTPSRQKIFMCDATSVSEEAACAEEILSSLARRAYRRPVTDEDVDILLGFYEANRGDGGFEAGIAAALERLLLDPEFLFKVERDPKDIAPDTAYRVSDLELASRLSFFLPMEQHPRRGAPKSGGARALERAGDSRSAGRPHAR